MVEVDQIISRIVDEAGDGLTAAKRQAMYSSMESVLERLKTMSR